jgi:DNA-binding XRE family transcriptional regulator
MITHIQCRAARAWLDLTQPDLAKLAGLNKNSVMKWESGKSSMHPNNVAAVERVFMERGVDFLSNPPGLRAVA